MNSFILPVVSRSSFLVPAGILLVAATAVVSVAALSEFAVISFASAIGLTFASGALGVFIARPALTGETYATWREQLSWSNGVAAGGVLVGILTVGGALLYLLAGVFIPFGAAGVIALFAAGVALVAAAAALAGSILVRHSGFFDKRLLVEALPFVVAGMLAGLLFQPLAYPFLFLAVLAAAVKGAQVKAWGALA